MDDSLRRTLLEYYANPEYIQAAARHAVSSRQKRLPILAEYLEPNGLAIEIGCGAGVYSDLTKQYVGLDISLEALRELKAKGRWAVCCDVAKMPIKDGVATTVLSFDTLEHVYEPQEVLEEVARVLKPGGSAILRDVWLKAEKHTARLPYKLRKKLGKLTACVPRLWRVLRGDDSVAWSRITPDYTQVANDHDAVSRIDAHSVYRFFRRRGFESVNERSNPVMRLLNPWMRHRNWVVVKKRRTTD